MRVLSMFFAFIGGCGANVGNYSSDKLISIAVKEAEKHESWLEIRWDPVVHDLPAGSPLWQEGTKVVTVYAYPPTPGCESDVIIGKSGKVIAYFGSR